ncbi:MAG: hypothetical protein PUB39_01725 [Eubacteriales bacterium]|nr:hypothetical protein [Eubacteriales bacterium]
MDTEELRELLDIEEDTGIEYFEDVAELFETGGEYDSEAVVSLLKDTDMEELSSILDEYFSQMEDDIPDDEDELYTLVDNIGRAFMALVRNISESREGGSDEYEADESEQALAEEIEKFHNWYSIEEDVVKRDEDGGESGVTMSEALFSIRGEKYGADEAEYDFSGALDYELSDYVMDIAGSVDMTGVPAGDYDDEDMGDDD